MVVDRPEGKGPLVRVLAMVDSGAYRSHFPLDVARDLGLSDDDLSKDELGGRGVGSEFDTWSSRIPIRAGIGRIAEDGSLVAWGPGFTLMPVFSEHEAFLLGREDFLARFDVTFTTEGGEHVFHLDVD